MPVSTLTDNRKTGIEMVVLCSNRLETETEKYHKIKVQPLSCKVSIILRVHNIIII